MDEGNLQRRGSLGFEFTTDGVLVNNAANVERLRQLWLDRGVINGELLGPRDPTDFDHGGWHVSCHLVAAGGVRRTADGRLLWLEISHDAARDRYHASVTHANDSEPRTLPVDSAEGKELVAGSTLLGFVEGSSTGASPHGASPIQTVRLTAILARNTTSLRTALRKAERSGSTGAHCVTSVRRPRSVQPATLLHVQAEDRLLGGPTCHHVGTVGVRPRLLNLLPGIPGTHSLLHDRWPRRSGASTRAGSSSRRTRRSFRRCSTGSSPGAYD